MINTNDNTETKEFALGPATLYIAGGRVSESELESSVHKAGDTDGGLQLKYESKLRELYDVEGNPAGTLRYGERLRLRGRLCRITPAAMTCFSRKGAVSVLIVCPLPDGDQLRLHIKGGIPTDTLFDASFGGGVSFEILFGRGAEHPTLRLAGETGGSL